MNISRKSTASAVPAAEGGYDNISIYVLGIFAAYIISWFMQLGSRIPALGAIRIEFSLAALLVFLALWTPRQRPKVTCNLYAFVGWFLVALLVEIPFSYNVEYSWVIFVDRVVKFACMACFIILFVRSPKALRFFIGAFMLAWFKMGQEGLLGQVTGSLVWENQGVMRLHGSTGLYDHPNSFSGLALGMLPFIYFLFPLANKWGKLFLLVLTFFSLTIVLYTGSRTGYIGFLLFSAYVVWQSKHKFKGILAVIVIAWIALPFIPQQYIERFESITGQEKEGHSKFRRIEILHDAVTIFSEHPFGVGVAAFPFIRQERFGRVQDTHNLYLEVATNLGVQGFLIWLLMIAALFRNIVRLSGEIGGQLDALAGARQPDSPVEPSLKSHIADLNLMKAILSAASGYIVIRLSVGLFGMDLYEIYWWFAMGIVISIHNMSQVAGRITESHLNRSGTIDKQNPQHHVSAVIGHLQPS